LAHVAVSKYVDHLPLYRLEGIFSRHNIDIKRSTLCDWAASTAELLTPLYDLMAKEILQSKVINSDDTPVRVQECEAKYHQEIQSEILPERAKPQQSA